MQQPWLCSKVGESHSVAHSTEGVSPEDSARRHHLDNKGDLVKSTEIYMVDVRMFLYLFIQNKWRNGGL